MKLYYHAVTQDGKTVRGLIEARDIKEAGAYLKKEGLLPIKISADNDSDLRRFVPFLKKSAGSEIVFFTRQLASMLTSGLTLMQALTIMKSQTQSSGMGEVVNGIIARVENGKSFSVAIESYPEVFPNIYIASVKAAESAGLLDKVLTRLAENLERADKLKRMIKGAMMYPVIVLMMMVGVMIVMLLFVVPQLSEVYTSMNITLPLPTMIVVATSQFIVNFWPLVLGICGVLVFWFNRWRRTDSGKRLIDKLVLKAPILGKLVAQSMMVEFSRTFGLLIGTGSLVVDSLNRSAGVVGNVLYRDEIMLVAKRVEKGISVGDAMEASTIFPPILVQMVKIGEQTGKLDDSLNRVSEYFEKEVEQTVKGLTTALEPIIMIILALGVGFLVMAVITPIYNLVSSIK